MRLRVRFQQNAFEMVARVRAQHAGRARNSDAHRFELVAGDFVDLFDGLGVRMLAWGDGGVPVYHHQAVFGWHTHVTHAQTYLAVTQGPTCPGCG